MNTTLFFILSSSVPLLILLSTLPLSRTEYTVVDSSVLIDAPQTGFSDHAKTDPTEQQAVYQIMQATGNGWATSIPDVCRGRWHGIECMPDKDEVYHIVSLSFGALSDDTAFPTCDPLHSFISPALLSLPHLRSLFFYRCFTNNPQQIPAFLGRLGSTLRSLVLRENGHVGAIPAELGNLKYLKVLDLHGNRLSFSIPSSFQRLSKLQLLDLSYNRINGMIPELKLNELTVIDLSHNYIQGQIPLTFGQCQSLIKIDFSRNRLNGPIPDTLSNLQNLMLLDVSHNHLCGPLPSSLSGLTSLRTLNLNANAIGSKPIPEDSFVGLTQLSSLLLSNNGMQGPIPESIGQLLNLRVLHLDGNQLNGSIPQSFRKLAKISELRLNDNKLTGPIPLSNEMLWKLSRKLSVSNNSGLCYDSSNGRYEDIESMSEIRNCKHDKKMGLEGANAAANTDSQGTEHLISSSSKGDHEQYYYNLSSSDEKFRHCGNFVIIVNLVFFVLLIL